MDDLIKREELELDKRRLRDWGYRKELIRVDNMNTYEEIDIRVKNFIDKNKNLTQKEVDNFISFLDYCNTYYSK